MTNNVGIISIEQLMSITPDKSRLSHGAVAIMECFEPLRCRQCVTACPRDAIMDGEIPRVDFDKCIGCGLCIAKCPAQAIFVMDMSGDEQETAIVKLPYEFEPVPKKGQCVQGLTRKGVSIGECEVDRVVFGGADNNIWIISVKVPLELASEIRNIRLGGDD